MSARESAHTNPMRVQILSIEPISDTMVRVTIGADDFTRPVFTVPKLAVEDPGFLSMLAHGTNYRDTVYRTRRETAKDRLRRAQWET